MTPASRLLFVALLPLAQACDGATKAGADAGLDPNPSAVPSDTGSAPTGSSPSSSTPSGPTPPAAPTQTAPDPGPTSENTSPATTPSPSSPPDFPAPLGSGGAAGNTAAGGAAGADAMEGFGGTPGGAGTAGSAGTTNDSIDAGSGDASNGGNSDAPDDGCPGDGQISYSLTRAANPTPQQQDAYDRITSAMDEALRYYNCYGTATKELRVVYEPSVPTADGNVNGSLRFGSTGSMNHITAMHEIAHTLGVGGGSSWNQLIVGGVYQGPRATATLRELTGDPNAELRGDAQHFWPYGLNYTSEVESEEDLIRHCLIVMGIREDLGLQ